MNIAHHINDVGKDHSGVSTVPNEENEDQIMDDNDDEGDDDDDDEQDENDGKNANFARLVFTHFHSLPYKKKY